MAMLKDAGDGFTEHAALTHPKLNDDENPAKPLSIKSAQDFDDMSQDMTRFFEGKETELNWGKRRMIIIKISRITHGNAPIDYRSQYISFIKSQLDNILKVVDSLRTNVSTAGLNLLQHIADTLGHAVDFMVGFVADTLITRCCNTTKVKRDLAITTFEVIITNATCNKNILHHVVSASEHKDPNARTAVSGWLSALLTKNGRHCDQPGVLDLIEKCIKNGLVDAKPQVRTPMRATYSLYAMLWSERADKLRNSLDIKTQKMLDSDTTLQPAKTSVNRPSMRDIKIANIREMKANRDGVRPPSAQSIRVSARDGKTSMEAEDVVRPSSSQSTRSMIREIKFAKKQDTETRDVVVPPSGQPNNSGRKRDMEAQDCARPMPGQLHVSNTERRFHILSSAPIRPRGFTTKPPPSLQQQADSDMSISPPLEDAGLTKPTDKKFYGLKNEDHAASQPKVSPPGGTIAHAPQPERCEPEMSTRTRHIAVASAPAAESKPAKVAANHVRKASKLHGDARSDERASSDHGKTKKENPIKIHEDGVSPDQIDDTKLPRVRKRNSVGKKAGKEGAGEKNARKVSPKEKSPGKGNSEEKSPGERKAGRGNSKEKGPGERRLGQRKSWEKMEILREVVKVPNNNNGSVRSPSSPSVLREILQLNDGVQPDKNQENNRREKYVTTEAAQRNRSVSPNGKDPDQARKQLSLAIEKVRARTMDDHGYRRLQGLIKAHDALFQDEERYDQLLLALLDTLETPNTERRLPLGRQFDNKFQILVTIRLMLVHSRKYCIAYHARALCAIITARRNFESRCHIVGGLEEVAEDIIAVCTPIDVIDPVLDVLELQEHDDEGYRAISMGLEILGGLIARIKGSEVTDKTLEQRLSRFALKCLRNENSETRRATIAFCVELRRLITPEERYFQMVAGNDEALKSLLTYFIVTTRKR